MDEVASSTLVPTTTNKQLFARGSGREYMNDFSSFEILLSMSFAVNYQLSGFPNHLIPFYIEKNRKEVNKIIYDVEKIIYPISQKEQDIDLAGLSIYKVLREYLPNFYLNMKSDLNWYLEPFWNLDKMESTFLIGLARGWATFHNYFHEKYGFKKSDILDKNLIKLICFFAGSSMSIIESIQV